MILLLNWRNGLRNALLPAWKTPWSLIGLCAERLTTNFVSITYEKQISSWRRPFYLVALLRNRENMLKNSNMPGNLLQSIWSAKGRYPRQTKAWHQSTFLTGNFAVVDIIVEIAQHMQSYATIVVFQIISHNAALKNNADPTLNKHATGRFVKWLATPTSERMNGRILSVR